MTDDLYNKTPEEPHPVVTAMNYMGYDAMTLGNHEFNWGIPTMQSILGQASFPVLAANVTGAQGEPVTGAGWTIVERGGVKLAVIGVVTPDVPIWDSGKDGIDAVSYTHLDVYKRQPTGGRRRAPHRGRPRRGGAPAGTRPGPGGRSS